MKSYSFLFWSLTFVFSLSLMAVYAGGNYDVGAGAITHQIPTYLENPEARIVNSEDAQITLQNALCYGVNTRGATGLVTGYQAGRTWIRISTFANGNLVGKFSIPLEVFQAVITDAHKASSLVMQRNKIGPMMQGLHASNTPAAEREKLLTPGWSIEADANTVKVTGFNPNDFLRKTLTFTYEKIYTVRAPPYPSYTEYVFIGTNQQRALYQPLVSKFTTLPLARQQWLLQARIAQRVVHESGFVVDDTPGKVSTLSFQQSASWVTATTSGVGGCSSEHCDSGVVRTQRPASEVSYTMTSNVLQLAPRLFGSGDSGCQGFTSPLMAFFDDARPRFSGTTSTMFKSQTTFWVEPKAPGYFLALDSKGNHKIHSADQLFGNTPKDSNGFEALKKLDSNRDGVIDKKDENFSKLVLWKDQNGNSKSERREVKSLSEMGVVRIELAYRSGDIHNYGPRAESHQWANFVYRDKAGHEKKGKVIDIWFSSGASVEKGAVEASIASDRKL